MILGRCGHQEGDVPKDVVPREETFSGRCSQEADVFGNERSSPGRKHPQGGCPWQGVPGKMMFSGRTHSQVEDDPEKMWSLGRRCPQGCLWEGDVLRKKTSLEGDVPSKETSLGRCHPQGVVPGRKMSLRRYHLLEGAIPRKDVPGKVSPTGRCLWKSVRKRMSLGRRDSQEEVPEKMSPERHGPGEEDSPRKQTYLGRRCPQEGDIPGRMSSPGR